MQFLRTTSLCQVIFFWHCASWTLTSDLPMPLLVTFGQGFTQVGVGTQVQWRLSFLVFYVQVRPVGRQEACDGGAGLLVCSRGAQSHQKLSTKKSQILVTLSSLNPIHKVNSTCSEKGIKEIPSARKGWKA